MSRNLSKEELHQLAETAAESGTQYKVSAKRYLETIRRMEYSIEEKKQELQRLREESIGIGGMNYDAVRVQTSCSGDAMARRVAKYVDLQQEIEDAILEKAEVRHKIIDQIQSMENPDYVRLLYKRYVEQKSLELISVEMSYVYDYTRRIHGRALQAFEEKYLRGKEVTKSHINMC